MMRVLEEVKRWIGEITEILLLLVALGIVMEILFGPTVLFFGQIIPNLTTLLKSLGDNGVVGLIALGVILWLFHKQKALA